MANILKQENLYFNKNFSAKIFIEESTINDDTIVQYIDLYWNKQLVYQIINNGYITSKDELNEIFYTVLVNEEQIYIFNNQILLYIQNDQLFMYDPEISIIYNLNLYMMLNATKEILEERKEKTAFCNILNGRLREVAPAFEAATNFHIDQKYDAVLSTGIHTCSVLEAKDIYYNRVPKWNVELIGDAIISESEFYNRLYNGFQFPVDYENNKNSILAGLQDLSWLQNNSFYIYFWNHFNAFSANKEVFDSFLEYFNNNVIKYWEDKTQQFILLLC